MYNRRNNHDHRDRNEKHEHSHHHPRKYNKNMIMLKSTVFALFIVLVVLLAAFEIIKHRKESNLATAKCDKNNPIVVSQAIETIKEENGVILVLTKLHEGKQEIIRLESACGKELGRIMFSTN